MMEMNPKYMSYLKSMIDQNMDMNRRSQNKVNFMSYFFVLYAYKIYYPLSFDNSGNILNTEFSLGCFQGHQERLLHDLYQMAIKESGNNDYQFQDVAVVYKELGRFNSFKHLLYKDVFEYLIEKMAMSAKRMEGEIVQPKEITEVVCHILKKHQACHVYNPFSGLASYAIGMNEPFQYYSYYGQDSDERAVLLSRLRLDAYDMNRVASVECADVLQFWGKENKSFDTIVATPPFGQRIHEISVSLFPNRMHHSRTMEEYILWNCLEESKDCKTAIVIVPSSFLSRKETFSLRKTLCDKKVLEMVVELPTGAFYGTGITTAILVLNFVTEQDYMTFIDAKNTVTGRGRDYRLDSEAIIGMIDGEHTETTTMVPYSETFHYDCILIPSLYESIHIPLSEGERLCRMNDLMVGIRGERVEDLVQCNVLNQSDFSSDFFEVIHKEDVVALTDAPIGVRKLYGPHLVLSMNAGKLAMYMHKGNTDFYIRNHHLAIKPNNNFVIPEYLVYLLLMSEWSKVLSKIMAGTHMQRINMLQFGNMKMGILNLTSQQNAFIEALKDKHKQELAQIHQAELERLGFRDVYSDVIHMLGTPFHKQGQVISLLERTNKDDEKYPQRVKALMDISMHIQRIIDIVGKDFSSTEADLDTLDLSDFIIEYHSAWNNYASGVYCMQIEVDADGSPMTIEADKDLLMVLMDTLTDNAKRHGFAPGYNPDNLVNISLQHVVFNEIPCVLLSVSNNGYPLKEGFTIQDYITRGRFEGKNGRTGLGGNHVYTIVKKHGGWLNIRSDKSWNFIVDMLFPMVNSINDNFNDYDYETI